MKKGILVFSFLLLVLGAVYAERYELDVQQAVDLAVEKNLSLKVEDLKLKAKEYEKNHVWNQFIPSIRFNPAFQYTFKELFDAMKTEAPSKPTTPVPGKPGAALPNPMAGLGEIMSNKGWMATVGGSAQLALNAGQFMSIDATVQDYHNSLISYETAVAQLERDIKKSYYNIILLAQSVALIQENYDTALKRYEQAQIRYSNGYMSKLQLLQTQSTVENIKPQLSAQKNALQLSILNFKLYLGLNFEDEIFLTEYKLKVNKVNFDLEKLIEENLTSRLDIKLLMGNLNYLQKSRAAFLTGQLSPSLIFGVNYNAMYKLDPKYEGKDPRQNGSVSIAFSLPIDQLIPGSTTQAKAQEMQFSADQLRVELQNALRLAEMDVRSISMNIDKSWENIQSLAFNINLNNEVYKESVKGYDAGKIDVLDLEETENRLKKAKIDFFSEKVTYLSNLADLEYALNCELSELAAVQEE